MEPIQTELFSPILYKSEVFSPKPAFTDPSWDVDRPITRTDEKGVYKDIPDPPSPIDSVLEQVKNDTSIVAPEHSHWIETYFVSRGHKKHYYYRYCYMVKRKIRHIHIPGGCTANNLSKQYCQEVRDAIATGISPQEIEKMIKSHVTVM